MWRGSLISKRSHDPRAMLEPLLGWRQSETAERILRGMMPALEHRQSRIALSAHVPSADPSSMSAGPSRWCGTATQPRYAAPPCPAVARVLSN